MLWLFHKHIHNIYIYIYIYIYLEIERSELAAVSEASDRRVDNLRHGGRDHRTEERLPGEALRPERRKVLHGEEQAADRRVETGRHAGRHACRRETPPACG